MANMYGLPACEYSVVSTAAAITTGPAYLYGISVYAKTTGSPKVLIYDATATGSGNFVLGAATSGTGVGYSLVLDAPIICKLGIWCNMSAGTSGADSVTVLFTQA